MDWIDRQTDERKRYTRAILPHRTHTHCGNFSAIVPRTMGGTPGQITPHSAPHAPHYVPRCNEIKFGRLLSLLDFEPLFDAKLKTIQSLLSHLFQKGGIQTPIQKEPPPPEWKVNNTPLPPAPSPSIRKIIVAFSLSDVYLFAKIGDDFWWRSFSRDFFLILKTHGYRILPRRGLLLKSPPPEGGIPKHKSETTKKVN